MAWLNPPEGDEATRPDESHSLPTVSGTPTLRPKEQMSLTERAAGGDEEAKQALAERKQRAKTKRELELRRAALSRGGWECPNCTWINEKKEWKRKRRRDRSRSGSSSDEADSSASARFRSSPSSSEKGGALPSRPASPAPIKVRKHRKRGGAKRSKAGKKRCRRRMTRGERSSICLGVRSGAGKSGKPIAHLDPHSVALWAVQAIGVGWLGLL